MLLHNSVIHANIDYFSILAQFPSTFQNSHILHGFCLITAHYTQPDEVWVQRMHDINELSCFVSLYVIPSRLRPERATEDNQKQNISSVPFVESLSVFTTAKTGSFPFKNKTHHSLLYTTDDQFGTRKVKALSNGTVHYISVWLGCLNKECERAQFRKARFSGDTSKI